MATGLQIQFTIPQDKKVKVGYKIAGATTDYVYLPQYLTYDQSPYTIPNVSNISYDIELTTISDCCGECSSATHVISLYPSGTTINASILFNVDNTGNIQAIVEFTDPITSSVTIQGQYTLKDINGTIATAETWTIVVPQNYKVFAQNIRQATETTQVTELCVSSISPSALGGKNIVIVNQPTCTP